VAGRRPEAEMDDRRQGSETWQDDARRRLQQVHRSTHLMLELSGDVELKDKRYTNNGHKVIMQAMMKENKCRSDKALVREARRAGAPSPEVHQLKKYNKELYVKPPTPPPAPPKEEKPKVDAELAGLGLFGSTRPAAAAATAVAAEEEGEGGGGGSSTSPVQQQPPPQGEVPPLEL